MEIPELPIELWDRVAHYIDESDVNFYLVCKDFLHLIENKKQDNESKKKLSILKLPIQKKRE
ncbi:putative ankyrin repeat protein [Megavirus courdo11]|uniref:Putative ankyrin repeat protein n=1 Tax=Megavirus courdo11 TaxID=1128140 RepID=K7YV77_9VIRU|nr:putative ankyrin repeat protein [Megavirus courdo11]